MLSNALKGLVVLDFGQLIAAPVCGMWMADLGATVIKIEPPQGELARHMGPPAANGVSFVVLTSNRNKLGLAIDLKHRDARAVVSRLVSRADVVLQNFRPGVAERLGLGWDTLKRLNPNLICCAISAYGQDSAWRERPGVDGIVQAASGLMSTIKGADGPGKVPLPLADMTGAMFALIAIQSALRARDNGRGGCFLDIDLFSGMMMLQQLNLAAFLTNGELPEASGSAASYAAPNEAFPTQDGWIMIAAYQPARWKALCDALDCRSLFDSPLFATNEQRVANRKALHIALDPIFMTRTASEWTDILMAADIMATPVATYTDVTRCAAYRPDKIEVMTDHPIAGQVRSPGFAFSHTNQNAQRPAPRLGEHSRSVLEMLGFEFGEIEQLVQSGVVLQGAA